MKGKHMTEEQLKFVEPILSTFENDDIKEFAVEMLNNLPSYIWEVGASSTGKYHPEYTLGTLGLMKHQVAVTRFVNFFFELEQYKNRFDSRHRDLIRLAAITHDGRKSGLQEDYEKSKYTKFEHPLLMAKEYLYYKDKDLLPEEELKYIARLVSSHMGQWNTDKRSTLVLPKPNDEASELLHLADYLASRKCLNMSFDDYVVPKEKLPEIDPGDYVLTFGKHKDCALKDIPKDYIKWLATQDKFPLKEPLKTFVGQIVRGEVNE
jgi:uncharacterized protein (DUF3820 family)